ncbi:SDR family oxidoreductase [Blautia sp. JLR.GB0024]|uniref:SDR family NAD(P)-dependent oxidoreductase n=1 Tax=Blautia sp. JLR.GB0024 TaxID=3123295 RepID=UPI003007347D
MDFQLEGKVALVTGGAEKAGRYFARSYAEAGADIVITHCHMPKEAEETEKEIEKLGRRCLAVDADNRNIPQLRRAVKRMEEYYGRLDILLHNASNFNEQPIDQVTEAVWDSSMEIILKGAFFLSQAAAPLMLKNGGGRMLAIIGNSYYENWPDFIPHSIAKIGLAKLMQMLAVTYSPRIQCNAVCPASFLDSAEGNDILSSRGEIVDEEKRVITIGGIPLHRGSKEEVAELILFLSACSNYINGAVIPVDAGKNLI